MKTKDLADFLSSLSESIEADKMKLFKEIINSSEIQQFDNYEEFYFAVIYPFENFISCFIQSEIARNQDVVFLMQNSRFVERNFRSLIEQREGAACCADKSRTIVKRLIDFYTTGNKIDFDYDGEYTYHLPREIFNNHDDVVMFYEGLKSLWYGQHARYLEAMKKVLDLNKGDKSGNSKD